MRVYTIHHDDVAAGLDREFVLVKEGFCWPAFVFTALWALWHRMWLVFVLLLVASSVLDAVLILVGADELSTTVIGLGYSLVIGFSANDWRRRWLERHDMPMRGIVAAADEEAALYRYVDRSPDLVLRRPVPPTRVIGLP